MTHIKHFASKFMLLTACLAMLLMMTLSGCSSVSEFAIEDVDVTELSQMMSDKKTFTLLVERDGCEFCNAMNEYIEETKGEHTGTTVYRLNTTDFELYREQEGDMTLVSENEQGTEFLRLFPYFLYTPSIYKIENGVPVSAGIGYDPDLHTVSVWDTDSTIDWNTASTADVWTFLTQTVKPQ